MTAQPRRTSLLEATTQAAVGLPVGLAVSCAVALLGLSAAVTAALITGLMFLASTARGYWIRRRFECRDFRGNNGTRNGAEDLLE